MLRYVGIFHTLCNYFSCTLDLRRPRRIDTNGWSIVTGAHRYRGLVKKRYCLELKYY